MMKINRWMFLLVSLSLVCGGTALADPIWICSITDSVGCDADGTVGTPDLGDLEAPTFFKVDAKAKTVTLLAPASRKGEVTKLNTVHEGDGIWIFSGLEADRAFSMVISESGYLTLSVTGDGGTWTVFGNTMLEED